MNDGMGARKSSVSAQMSTLRFSILRLRTWRFRICTKTSWTGAELGGDLANQLIGTIDLDVLKGIPASQWRDHRVSEYSQPLALDDQVTADLSLLDVVEKLEKEGSRSFAVVSKTGTLLGLLEKSTILGLLQQTAEPKQA